MEPKSTEPIRAFHLITSLGGGGTENFLTQVLSRSPASMKHRVFYLGRDGVNGDRIRALGIPVERIGLWRLYRLLRNERPDVLHTCLFWAHQAGRLIGRQAGVPFILSSHQSIDIWQKPWHRLLDRCTLPLCDAVDFNSEASRRLLEDRLGSARKRPRLFKVENGLNFDLFKPSDRVEAKRLYGIPPEAAVGGTLMRLHAEKGAEKIPGFAEALLQKHPNLYLVIAGTGPMETSLKRQTQSLGDRLRWVGWQDQAVRFLSALDFFWLLSREESFPQALLEASGVGLPWIAPDVGGVRELLDAGACGFIHPSQDLETAVSNAGQVLAQRESCQAKARGAVPRLKNRYDLAIMVNAFYNIVESRGR
jgi:glycosyltransferase involved in cell wall biosynthesis